MSLAFHVSIFDYCSRIVRALRRLNFNIHLLSVQDILSVVATFCTIYQSQLVISDSVDFNTVVGSIQQKYCHLQDPVSHSQCLPLIVTCDTQFSGVSEQNPSEYGVKMEENRIVKR